MKMRGQRQEMTRADRQSSPWPETSCAGKQDPHTQEDTKGGHTGRQVMGAKLNMLH